ncbi:MAG: DUF547 domain-containing protein [Inhella sp.]|jgi:hypothetical protein|uniref:DUF547 domain-containing protein n=1 Tax=Inhella sp. TaxID=1921806 RepID=UPI0026363D67|nr:DUF547 domain-containing protein [Inhella sp.]
MGTRLMQRRALLLAVLPLTKHAQSHAQSYAQSHEAWSTLLRQHVRLLRGGQASQLDYRGMASQRKVLQSYLAGLSAVPLATYQAWPRTAQMAHLINAYNAFTVELILSRYPALSSIKDVGSLLRSPWKRKWVPLLGQTLSLDEIEHERLRPVFRDPRIHFAVNCASIGCPMLREEAYLADRLDAQLDQQTDRFLRDRTRNRVENGVLWVSKIFDWYADDFGPRLSTWLGGRAALLSDKPAEQQAIAAEALPIRFLDYDWALNDPR